MSVPNILATRYASAAMRSIWTPENKIRAERRLWPVSYTHLTLPTTPYV